MAGRAAPTAIAPSGERGYRSRRQARVARSDALASTDRFARMPLATRPAARQRPRPGAEKPYGEVSWRFLSPARNWRKPDIVEGYQAPLRSGNAIVRLPNIHLDIRGRHGRDRAH